MLMTMDIYCIVFDGTRDVHILEQFRKYLTGHLKARSKGRPKQRREDNVIQEIRQLNIKNWTVCVQDRTKWENVVEKAKTFNKRSKAEEEEEEEEEEGRKKEKKKERKKERRIKNKKKKKCAQNITKVEHEAYSFCKTRLFFNP